jgi:hypothetical protein
LTCPTMPCVVAIMAGPALHVKYWDGFGRSCSVCVADVGRDDLISSTLLT